MALLPEARKRFQFRLDDGTGVPAYRQIMDQVAAGIARGAFKAGDQLPTVRLGRYVRFRRSEIELFLDQQKAC